MKNAFFYTFFFTFISLIVLSTSFSAMAEGDVKKGKKVFRKCASCHSVQKGENKIGPSLYGVVGRAAGTIDGMKYSKVMTTSGIIWNEDNLRKFLARPRAFLKGTKMTFAGLKKEKDLDNVLAFLKDATKPDMTKAKTATDATKTE